MCVELTAIRALVWAHKNTHQPYHGTACLFAIMVTTRIPSNASIGHDMGRIVVIALFEAGFSKLYPVVYAYGTQKSQRKHCCWSKKHAFVRMGRLSTPELLGPSSICTNSSKLMAPSFAKSWNMRARAIKHSKLLTRMQTQRCAAKGCGQHSMIQR